MFEGLLSKNENRKWRVEAVLTDAEKRELAGEHFRDRVVDHIDLSGADLRNARFENVSLCGSDFSDADLRGAIFVGCDLKDTLWAGARFGRNRFDGSLLVGSAGLSPLQLKYIVQQGGSLRRRVADPSHRRAASPNRVA